MNQYSIAYKTDDDVIFRETFIEAKNEDEALEKLYKQLGNKQFYYDEVVLEYDI